MDAKTRKYLGELIKRYETAIDELQAVLHDLHEEIDGTSDTLREKYENKSEKWQESEKGQAAYSLAEKWERFQIAGVILDVIALGEVIAEMRKAHERSEHEG